MKSSSRPVMDSEANRNSGLRTSDSRCMLAMEEARKKPSRKKAGADPKSLMQTAAAPSIITTEESALAKVTTIPSKSVTFFPNDKRQQTYVVLQNNSDRRVMFKMKSTRPGVYKMKPVFGVVNPGDKSSVRLVFMGIKLGYRIPVNDRITIVLAAVAQKGPMDGKVIGGATEGEMRKRRIYILFKGVNDQKEIVDTIGSKDRSAENVPEKGMNMADQQLYMNGYDEGYKVALLEASAIDNVVGMNYGTTTSVVAVKLLPKGAQGPDKALEQIRATKGIGKEPAYEKGFMEGYKKSMALLRETEKFSRETTELVSKEDVLKEGATPSMMKEPFKPVVKGRRRKSKGKPSREIAAQKSRTPKKGRSPSTGISKDSAKEELPRAKTPKADGGASLKSDDHTAKTAQDADKGKENEQKMDEMADKEAREKIEREKAENEAKKCAEREANEKAEREKIEKEMREKAEQEIKELREKAEKEIKEKAERELQSLRARAEREVKEKADRELKELKAKAEREMKEKFEKEMNERLDKELKEKAEREMQEKAEKDLRDKAEKERRALADKEMRDKFELMSAQLEKALKAKAEMEEKDRIEKLRREKAENELVKETVKEMRDKAEKEIQEKFEKMKLDFEKQMKEKAEKEERSRMAREQKEKAEKDRRLKLEKEMKARAEKELKERLENEKKDKIKKEMERRAEKAMKQKAEKDLKAKLEKDIADRIEKKFKERAEKEEKEKIAREKAEKEKRSSVKPTKPTDGTNVTAFTPGGTDPSLGDPLKRKDIVHIGPSGKKQIVIIMYRDPKMAENLLSLSGDEDDDDNI